MDEKEILRIIKESLILAKKGNFQPREIFFEAKKLFELKYILSIIGVRRCGKSTLLKELVRIALEKTSSNNILYLNLEHPFFNQYKNDVNNLEKIYLIFKENCEKDKKIFVFFDEIQFFTDWQVFIKHLYEKNEAKIVITGSNSRLLSSELATLLSGRNIPLQMYPFSIEEAKTSYDKYIFEGGFPEFILGEAPKELLAENYYKNILYQDVIPRFGIKNSIAMENLSYYLISNIGKELSYNTLKSISGLDDKTVKQYISYLQDANLMYVMHNYDFSLKKLIGNKKKIYVVDPLFTYISFRNSPDKGRLFENFVYMFLKRTKNDIYFYNGENECDFLIKEGFSINCAMQVCFELNDLNRNREIQGVLEAMKKFKLSEGYIITTNSSEKIKFDDNMVHILSVKQFIEKFGMNSENN